MEKLAELINFGAVLFKLLQHYKLKITNFLPIAFLQRDE